MNYKRLHGQAVLLATPVVVVVWICCSYLWSGLGSNLSRVKGKEVPQFDCFSRPAIAAAILRQEADRCVLEYEGGRDLKNSLDAKQLAAEDFGNLASQVDRTVETKGAKLSRTASNQKDVPTKTVEELDRTITELKNDLDRKLMLLYFEKNLSNQFLNLYLNQAQGAPDGNTVVWARYALECSRTCGRTMEVLDAMHHLNRFRQEVKGLKGLQAVLDDWANHNSLARTANGR